MVFRCALESHGYYDAAIGNPPFIRNQDISPIWRRTARNMIEAETGEKLHGLQNLYAYFMWLSMIRTHAGGIVALVVPFEWVSRPSTLGIREYIGRNRWGVAIYRIPDSTSVFPDVKTTASITLIDKRPERPGWSFYDIDKAL